MGGGLLLPREGDQTQATKNQPMGKRRYTEIHSQEVWWPKFLGDTKVGESTQRSATEHRCAKSVLLKSKEDRSLLTSWRMAEEHQTVSQIGDTTENTVCG